MVRCLTLMAGLAVPLLAQESEPSPPDAKRIQGAWTIVKATADGAPAPKEKMDAVFTFDGKVITVKSERDDEPPAAYKLDPSKKPAEIDITPGRGGPMPVLGIYRFEKDELTLVFHKPGAERPKGFDDKKANVIVLRRQKEEKK